MDQVEERQAIKLIEIRRKPMGCCAFTRDSYKRQKNVCNAPTTNGRKYCDLHIEYFKEIQARRALAKQESEYLFPD